MSEVAGPRLELGTIRGIACLALVAYHVVGPTPVSGMHLPQTSAWHHAMNSFDFLRMPLFSVLSGFLYAGHRVDRSSLPGFFRKKALRLLAPLLFVTLIMMLLRRAVYGDATTLLHALLFHYQHLWFIQALAVIFLVIGTWDSVARPNWVGLSVAAFGAIMLSRSFELTTFFSINGAFYLGPFFLFGMILRVHPAILDSKELLLIAAWFVGIVMLLQQATTLASGVPITRTSLAAAVCGFGAGFLLLALCPKLPLFEAIGAYSYTIYLWHSIAASAVRHTLQAFVGLPQVVEFSVLLAVGMIVPIGMHIIVERIPILSLFVAGLRNSKRLRPRITEQQPVPPAALSAVADGPAAQASAVH